MTVKLVELARRLAGAAGGVPAGGLSAGGLSVSGLSGGSAGTSIIVTATVSLADRMPSLVVSVKVTVMVAESTYGAVKVGWMPVEWSGRRTRPCR